MLLISFRPAETLTVKVEGGKIEGYVVNGIKIFKGIPFAAPPVGNLRWREPQPVEKWNGVRACIDPPASAMQGIPRPFFCWSKEFLIPESPISEDCLYLNIWTPAKNPGEKLPVIVWIHGGGFSAGSGTVPLYDGEAMAGKGVVFVTINYRLGIFGFFAHPQLSAESDKGVSGNYGILDQIAALKWVRNNIDAFGGDPGCVTIAGQSAGAFSVNMLVVSSLAKGLFHRAIAESGGMFGKELSLGQSLSDAEAAGKELTDKLGIASMDTFRKLPADSLLKIQGRYSIAVDNVVIPEVAKTFREGKQNDVPLIYGWNADDGVMFGAPAKSEDFIKRIRMQYKASADEFLKVFPASDDKEAAQSQKILTQLQFGWNNYAWAKLQSRTGSGKAFLYYFKRVPPGEPNFGAFHSAEFAYALHNLKKWERPFTDTDFRLENIMSTYWVNFARTGDPNGEGVPVWIPFDQNDPRLLEMGDDITVISLPFVQQLIFLDKIN